MKFSAGDLVMFKDGVIRDLRDPKVGIFLDSWPIEHAKYGYVYTIGRVQFGRSTREVFTDDFELVSKIVEKSLDRRSAL